MTRDQKNATRLAIAVLLLGGVLFWILRRADSAATSAEESEVHKPVESKMALTESQRAELPLANGRLIAIYRTRSAKQPYQVVLTQKSEPAPAAAYFLGYVDERPGKGGELDQPLYLCRWPRGEGTDNTSLSIEPGCFPGGKRVRENPVGYASKTVRAGFRALTRCHSAAAGLYLSLNDRCESAADQPDAVLGAVRAKIAE